MRAINVLADCIGRSSPRYVAFGLAALRLDAVLSLVPALVACTVLATDANLGGGFRRVAAPFRQLSGP